MVRELRARINAAAPHGLTVAALLTWAIVGTVLQDLKAPEGISIAIAVAAAVVVVVLWRLAARVGAWTVVVGVAVLGLCLFAPLSALALAACLLVYLGFLGLLAIQRRNVHQGLRTSMRPNRSSRVADAGDTCDRVSPSASRSSPS